MTQFNLNTNIDDLIAAEQKKLEQLMLAKKELDAKREALKEVSAEFNSIYEKYGITENEYFASIADNLEEWIKDSVDAPIYQSLAKHFERQANKVEKAPAAEKTSSLPKPKLKVGTYRNPATGETVAKIKRSPKILDQWIEEYGFAIVRTWKID